MTKLFQLREWLTVPESAKHLSTILQEEVTEPDILRLALDRKIVLSVYFVNHAQGKLGRAVPFEKAYFMVCSRSQKILPPIEEARYGEFSPEVNDGLKDHRYMLIPCGDYDREGNIIYEFDDEITSVEGVWDLLMLGSEALDVEHLFQQLTGGPQVSLVQLAGPIVYQGDLFCKIHERFSDKKSYSDPGNWYPAAALPDDSVFVIRAKELTRFIESLQNPPQETQPFQPKYAVQEQAILEKLEEMGFDPKGLPRTKGTEGAKAKVRRALEPSRLFTRSSFDKAWQHLRDQGEIKNIES